MGFELTRVRQQLITIPNENVNALLTTCFL